MNLAYFKTFILLAPATLALAACQQHKDAQSESTPTKPGISVTDGTLNLPVIKGNPGAAYFTLANRGKTTARIAAIDIDGAVKVEMHDSSQSGMMAPVQEVPVKPGERVTFAPGGKHAMVFELGRKLVAGGTTEMTVRFEDGDKVSAPLKITASGADAMSDMRAMPSESHS